MDLKEEGRGKYNHMLVPSMLGATQIMVQDLGNILQEMEVEYGKQ